jgi:PAS domain S-box-containing protein
VSEPGLILIVDDDPGILWAQRNLLSMAGHTVIEAVTGSDVLEMVRKHRPDLVLLDVVLPELNGLEICWQIKTDPDLKDTLVVLCSGLQTESDEQVEGLEMGADGYIARPIPNREMLARVEAMLRIRRAEKALRESEERYRRIVETAEEGILLVDREWKTNFVNTRAEQMLGYKRGEMMGRRIWEFMDDEGRRIAKEQMVERESGVRGSQEFKFIRQDGTELWTNVSSNPYINKSGHFVGALAMLTDITERKRTEQALVRSEEHFRTLVEGAPDAIFVQTRGRFAYLNAAALRLFEATSVGQLLGKPIMERVHPDHHAVVRERIRSLNGEKKGASRLEQKYLKLDGSEIDVEVSAEPFKYEDHDGALVFVRDITERKKAEEALKSSEEKYRTLHESMMDGFVSVDMAGRIKDFNEPYRQMLGYSREELPCLRYTDLTPERWHAFERDIVVSQILAKGYSEVYEKEYRKKDGTVFPVELRTFLVKEGRDREQQMWAIVRDISKRKWMEEKLSKSEERYRAIVDNAAEGIFQTTPEGRYFSVNPALVRMFGFSSAQEMIETATDIGNQLYVNLEDRLSVIEMLREQEKVEGFETETYRKDGSKFWISINIHTVKDSTGNILYLEGTTVDITERKRAEELRQQMELQRHQILKAESLGRMAAAIAHNFNNLLGIVIGNLELAMSDLPQGSQPQSNVAQAMAASGRAAEVGRLMLAYLGQSVGTRVPIELSEVCRETLPQLTASLPEKVHLKIDLLDGGLIIRADAVQIKQVLTNLVMNAGEAMGDREGDVSVAVTVMPAADIRTSRFYPPEWEPTEENYVCLLVSDTGAGMDQETLEKVFDPFFSTKFTGRGLGLAVVEGVVRAHEGALTVESAPGRGTVFRVFLPLSARELRLPPMAEPVDAVPPEERGLVLLVEDEPMLRQMAQSMLELLGCEVITAGDGVEALEVFRKHQDHVRCALLDLAMPRMDGWETLAALRALRPDLPVILASGYDEARVMQGDHPERPQTFLQKPYRMRELEEALGAARKASPASNKEAR